jgi:hypothetical protein
MIRKKHAPHLMRGVQRFSEKHALGLAPRDHAQKAKTTVWLGRRDVAISGQTLT